MNMEQMGNESEEKVGLANQMQAMLAKRHGEALVDFIDHHAEEFRDYIDKNGDVLNSFKDNPEETLNLIEPVLYH